MTVTDRPRVLEPATDAAAASRQIRRTWLVLLVALGTLLILCTLALSGAYWYRGHATVKKMARVEVVQGDRAFIRGVQQKNWNGVPQVAAAVAARDTALPLTYLHEGETLRTEDGTRVLLTLWDGSTIEVFDRTQLQVVEMRTTQYISRASALTLRQTRGLVRVTFASGDYSRSRFQVLAGDATVVMKEGEERASGGSFLVEVTLGPDNESISVVRASVRRGVGTVHAAGQEIVLDANEQTVVPAGQPPGAPTAARRDLVLNGTFTPVTEAPAAKRRFAPWQEISTPGLAAGSFGRLDAVRDTIGQQPVTALECYRSPDSTDPATTGLRQALDVTVAGLVALELTADIKVLDQNVPGGGQAGTEFPLIVRVDYHDATGVAQTRIWGFYTLPDPSGAKPENGRLIPAGKWTPLSIDLRALTPQPARLDAIQVYASGHGYRARITNVAIVGTE